MNSGLGIQDVNNLIDFRISQVRPHRTRTAFDILVAETIFLLLLFLQ